MIIVSRVNGKDVAEEYDRAKLLRSLHKLSFGLDAHRLQLEDVVTKMEAGLPAKLTKLQLYDLVSESLANKVIYHPDYSSLAGRVEAIKLQKHVGISFSKNLTRLKNHHTKGTTRTLSYLSDSFYTLVMENHQYLDSIVRHKRDLNMSYFGIKTLQKSYLMQLDGECTETPQYLFLRVAICIHGNNLDDVKETYDLMSKRYFIHASPTLFNAGTRHKFLSSCFLLAMEDDSIDGIYKTLHKTALISKAAGGIGLHVHNIRAEGAKIASTNGTSSGLIPMLKVFNDTARYVDQGGNKRPGAFAIYIEPWHLDIFDVLDLKKNHGKEERRARDLFYGLWVPDLFMERVKQDSHWTLFSPDEAPGISDCYGDDFKTLYESYEADDRPKKTISAQKLWLAILQSQTETGGPFMLYKDACNTKSNQKNLGTIKSSNLCCEIVEYSSPEETAVCNLGSLALATFVKMKGDVVEFDFEKLHHVTKVLTKNLNRVIDITNYPIPSSKVSNLKHRPIAIGVQGLADLFCELRIPFGSPAAKTLNIQIFETIYHSAIETSIDLAISEGPYSTFEGSPASKGLLQFDLWNHKPSDLYGDWDGLKARMQTFGLRNSLLVAPMPTASTSQILGYNECFEPFTSNIYSRRVLSGEYQIVNRYLLKDLIDLGLWNSAMRNRLILENGSIQNIPSIPQDLKELYKTVWEISQKVIVDMAADRGKFIDQLQSMNIHLKDPTFGKLTSFHFYAWEKGLKTGMYYLRTQAASRPIQFTVDTIEASKADMGSVANLKGLQRKKYHEVNKVNVNTKRPPPRTDSHIPKRIKVDSLNTPDSLQLSQEYSDTNDTKEFDIYDTTPITCDIKDQGNCESCSG